MMLLAYCKMFTQNLICSFLQDVFFKNNLKKYVKFKNNHHQVQNLVTSARFFKFSVEIRR